MFHILNERSLSIWKREIEVVHSNHGLITILAHPDYLIEPWAQEIYVQLLRHLGERAANEQIWRATPREVNDWWRIRSKLSLQRKDGGWQIEGNGSDRARIAYAFLDGENIRYSLVDPALPCAQHARGEHRDGDCSMLPMNASTKSGRLR